MGYENYAKLGEGKTLGGRGGPEKNKKKKKKTETETQLNWTQKSQIQIQILSMCGYFYRSRVETGADHFVMSHEQQRGRTLYIPLARPLPPTTSLFRTRDV